MIDTIAKFTSQIWMCLTMLHIKQDVSDSTVSCTKLHVCPFPDMWVEVWQQRSTWPKIKRRQVLTMTKSLDNEHVRSMSASHINNHQRRSIKIMRTTANSKSQNRVSVLQITAQMMTTSNSFNYKFKECHLTRKQMILRILANLYNLYAFRCSAPAVWNSLPKAVLSSDSAAVFKSRLKTFLFSQTFSSFSAH